MVKVEGFKAMKADVSKQEVVVQYDPAKTDPKALAEAITRGTPFKAVPKGQR